MTVSNGLLVALRSSNCDPCDGFPRCSQGLQQECYSCFSGYAKVTVGFSLPPLLYEILSAPC